MAHAGSSSGGSSVGGATFGGGAGDSIGGKNDGGVSGGGAGSASGAGGASGLAGAGGAVSSGGAANEHCDNGVYDPQRPPQQLALTGNLGTHDPMVLSAGGKYYLFSTGNNLAAKISTDLLAWQGAPEPLPSASRPAWLAQKVPGVSNLWAPDASFFGGQYHLYYSASTFGSNRSCIGHLSRANLAQGSWMDRGSVICSNVDSKDDFNAIDPNVVVDVEGKPWLSFGSFWSGIKLIPLDDTGARVGTSITALASRPGAGGALEAPFMVRRCGFYYLFVSWDKCCQGADSTYNIRVGRAASVTGPFVDKDGKAMLEGGGTLLLQGGVRYKGPGHNAILLTATGSYNVYHAYDANNDGASVLRIAELAWDADGWPVSAGP